MIPGIRFLCVPKNPAEIRIDDEELVDYAWVTLDQVDHYKLIPGLKEDIYLGCKMYKIFKNIPTRRST